MRLNIAVYRLIRFLRKFNFTKTAIKLNYSTYGVPNQIRIKTPSVVSFFYICLILLLLSVVYSESGQYIYYHNFKIPKAVILLVSGAILICRHIINIFFFVPKIVIDFDGIRFRDHGLVQWEDIDKLYIRYLIRGFNFSARLIVKTKKLKYSMWLENSSRSRREINFWIEFFKNKKYKKKILQDSSE